MKDNKKLLGWTGSLLVLVDSECHFYRAIAIPLLLSFKVVFFFSYTDKHRKGMKYLKYISKYLHIKIPYSQITLQKLTCITAVPSPHFFKTRHGLSRCFNYRNLGTAGLAGVSTGKICYWKGRFIPVIITRWCVQCLTWHSCEWFWMGLRSRKMGTY